MNNEIRKLICFRTSKMETTGNFNKGPSLPKILTITIIMMMMIQSTMSNTTDNVNITTFSNHKGIYYESHGSVSTSHMNWDLVVYVNVDILTSKYNKLMAQYKSMEEICKQMVENFGSVEIENTCNQFVQQFSATTLPYLYEIQSNRHNVMLSIGHHSITKNRIQRGLGSTFKRLINVLYGKFSNIDPEFIFRHILELNNNKMQSINLENEQTRIVQRDVINLNLTAQKISEHQQKLEGNLQYLQQLTKDSIRNINKQAFKTRLLEQAFLFEIILNQYAYETQNLIAVINAALDGKIHTSVIPLGNFLQELKEIKMNLPAGSKLPIEIVSESTPELLGISDITIFIQEENLVFSIAIPLLSNKEFHMYRPIPIPIPHYDNKTLILIDPEIEYLALSNDNEEFFSLDSKQWEACVKLTTRKICKGNQLFHRRTRSNICEISLLTSQTIPEPCKIKFLMSNTPIWSKLVGTNAWLFFSPPNFVTIKCTEPQQIINIEISGIGRLITSPTCEIHTNNFIILPTNKPDRTILDDLIPEGDRKALLSVISEHLQHFIPQNLKGTSVLGDFNSFARKLIETDKLPTIPEDHLIMFGAQFHAIINYILSIIIVTIISIIVIRFKNKLVRMYSPELPENQELNNL